MQLLVFQHFQGGAGVFACQPGFAGGRLPLRVPFTARPISPLKKIPHQPMDHMAADCIHENASMRIKSYYSRSVEIAIAEAREELGPEAMLVESRKAAPDARHLGEYEVIFALTSNTPPADAKSIESSPATPPPPDRLSLDVAELKKELEGMRRAITRTAFASPQWLGAAPGLSDAYAMLTANEVAPDLARDIVQSAESRSGGSPRPRVAQIKQPRDEDGYRRAMVEELESRFTVKPVLGRTESGVRITALVGPPGAGKTTTLVKLAVNYGLVARRPVVLISMDNHRIAAAEQLRSYASILGVGFQLLETVSALAQCIEEHRAKDLILIDTPGLGFTELGDSSALAHFLSTRADIDTQLALAASVKPVDLSRMVDAYQVFKPQRLMFTKLDETTSYGPIFNEAVRTGMPLSFFATGQRIPEDLEEVTAGRLSSLILSGQAARSRSVA
jgi:flagellar biosynthesis protein FlhF